MKVRSRVEYSIINIFANLGGYFLSTIIGFVSRIFFVRILSADYLGVSGLFTNILSVLSLAELGIGSAIGYALYKPIAEDNKKKITALMAFYGRVYQVIGVIVATIGLAIMPFLNRIITAPPNIKENIYLIYLFYLFNTSISYFFSYRSTLLAAMQRNYIVVGYSYVISILQSIAQIVCISITHSYMGWLIIQSISGICYNVWISLKAKKDYPYILDKPEKLSKQEKVSLFWNIKALTVNKLSGVLVNSTDNIAITYFNGLLSVGFASNYILLSSMLDALVTKTFNGLTGSVGNLNASKNENERYSFFKVLNLANFWLYGWISIGMAFVSSDMVALFFGEEYVLPFKIPFVLSINLFTIGMLHASYTYKSTLGLFKYGQYILIFTGIINIILDIILGKRYGMLGIYLATFFARLCTNLWYEPYAVYKYGLNKSPVLYLKRYLKMVGILIITGGVCWILCNLCRFNLVCNIVIKIIICSVIPNSMFLVFFYKTDEFIYIKNIGFRLMNRYKNRK